MQSLNIYLTDLLHIDDLVEHAQFHEEELGDNWVSFYMMHFGSESKSHLEDKHQEKHEKLPKHTHLNLSVIPVFVPTSSPELLVNDLFQIEKNTAYAYVEMIPKFLGNDIFQPPIVA
jgi:hypothetical protein